MQTSGPRGSPAPEAAPEAVPAEILIYLNRLSDLLFTLARLANHRAGAGDTTW